MSCMDEVFGKDRPSDTAANSPSRSRHATRLAVLNKGDRVRASLYLDKGPSSPMLRCTNRRCKLPFPFDLKFACCHFSPSGSSPASRGYPLYCPSPVLTKRAS